MPHLYSTPIILGRISLSLALGSMVVAWQILLIFNLSYLPCSVKFVNKNYCHAKKQKKTISLRPVDAIILCVMMYCEFGRSFNEHTKRSETERGSDVESQMSEVGKRLRSENHWELLQEKRTDMKLYFFERGIPVDLSIIKFVKILRFRLQQKLSRKKNTFIFTLNLHQESLNAPYHWKDEFSLFKTVYRLIRKRVLVKGPVQRKLETP